MDIIFILLELLITGNAEQQNYILSTIKADYIQETALREVFEAAKRVRASNNSITLITVCNEALKAPNAETQKKRRKVFREYLLAKGEKEKDLSSPKAIDKRIQLLIAGIAANEGFPHAQCNVKEVCKAVIEQYVYSSKNALLQEEILKANTNIEPLNPEVLSEKLKALDELLVEDTWKKYIIDPDIILREPPEPPLIMRQEEPFFHRGNLYMVSGKAGSMKSLFCLTIAAAAVNNGGGKERTLSFHSSGEALKVLYVDTELSHNTQQKRISMLSKMMADNRIEPTTFKYMALAKAPGGIDTKIKLISEAYTEYHPDLLILDSIGDLCNDFNESLEAKTLVDDLHQQAQVRNMVIIVTSHQSLLTNNAKGHLGVRINERCALEISLRQNTTSGKEYIEATFPKKREGGLTSFMFNYDTESDLLMEYNPYIEYKEETRQNRDANKVIMTVLEPGERISKTELRKRIISKTGELKMKGKSEGVSSKTANRYITIASGTTLINHGDGSYSLNCSEQNITFPNNNEDLPF